MVWGGCGVCVGFLFFDCGDVGLVVVLMLRV